MKTLKQQIETKCIHFNGIMEKRCRAGMVYDEIDAGNRVAYRAKLPCHKPDKHLPEGETQCACPHVEFPSEEEVQRQLDDHEAHIKKMRLALEVIDPIRKEQEGKNWRGVIECPNCKGKLHVSHAACNGHVHAKCETEGCVAWME